jgi:hypothetical protein
MSANDPKADIGLTYWQRIIKLSLRPMQLTERAATVHSTQRCLLSRLCHFPHDFIEVETGRLLPRWIVLKVCHELSHVVLCRDNEEGVIKKPVVVGVWGDVCSLVVVSPKVEHLRDAQGL